MDRKKSVGVKERIRKVKDRERLTSHLVAAFFDLFHTVKSGCVHTLFLRMRVNSPALYIIETTLSPQSIPCLWL